MTALRLAMLLPFAFVAGCALVDEAAAPGVSAPESSASEASSAAAPPSSARTAEEFDTTTAEQRATATAVPARGGEARLGTTIISLGPPAEPGLWLRTGLVSEKVTGRVEYPQTGASVTLELRPSGAAATGGSEISLAAMRLLGVPLTALPEVIVYRR